MSDLGKMVSVPIPRESYYYIIKYRNPSGTKNVVLFQGTRVPETTFPCSVFFGRKTFGQPDGVIFHTCARAHRPISARLFRGRRVNLLRYARLVGRISFDCAATRGVMQSR